MLYSLAAFAADDWKSYFKNDEVEILYRYADCHDIPNGIHQQKILLRFVNKQNKKAEVFYKKELTFSTTSAAAPDVRLFSVVLDPQAIQEGTCDTRDNRLFMFSKQLNFKSTYLTHFDLKDITVKTIQ
jgi:hypothetical protein